MAGNIAGAQRREALKSKYRARLPRFTPTAIFSQYSTIEIPASPTGNPAPSTTSATSTDNEDDEPVTTSSQPPVPRPTTITLRTSSLPSSSRSPISSTIRTTPAYSVPPSSMLSTASSSSTTIAAEANGAVSDSRGGEIIGIIASVFIGSMMLISAFAFYWRRRNMKARAKRTSRFRSSLMVQRPGYRGYGASTSSSRPPMARQPPSILLPSQAMYQSYPAVVHHTPMQGYPNSPGRMEAFWRSIDEEVNGSKKSGNNHDVPSTRTGSVASACRAVPEPEFHHRHGRNSHHSIAASRFNEFPRLQQALRGGRGGGGESPPLTSPLDEFPTPPSFVASPTSRYDRQRPSVGSLPMTVHSGTSFLDFDDDERRRSGHIVGRAL